MTVINNAKITARKVKSIKAQQQLYKSFTACTYSPFKFDERIKFEDNFRPRFQIIPNFHIMSKYLLHPVSNF